METQVQEFIEAKRAEQRKQYEQERDKLLISLGLIKEVVREYSPTHKFKHPLYVTWDKEQKNYYYEKSIPYSVTDEEYEEIKRLTQQQAVQQKSPQQNNAEEKVIVKYAEPDEVSNGAEVFLGVINTIGLVLYIIAAVIVLMLGLEESLFLALAAGAGVLLMGFISWAIVKVILNISNNLHHINSKLK